MIRFFVSHEFRVAGTARQRFPLSREAGGDIQRLADGCQSGPDSGVFLCHISQQSTQPPRMLKEVYAKVMMRTGRTRKRGSDLMKGATRLLARCGDAFNLALISRNKETFCLPASSFLSEQSATIRF